MTACLVLIWHVLRLFSQLKLVLSWQTRFVIGHSPAICCDYMLQVQIGLGLSS